MGNFPSGQKGPEAIHRNPWLIGLVFKFKGPVMWLRHYNITIENHSGHYNITVEDHSGGDPQQL